MLCIILIDLIDFVFTMMVPMLLVEDVEGFPVMSCLEAMNHEGIFLTAEFPLLSQFVY